MKKEQLWPYFFNMFSNQDQFVVYQASRIIAKLACWSAERMPSSDLSYYLAWLKEQLKPQVSSVFFRSLVLNKEMMNRVMNICKVYVEVYKWCYALNNIAKHSLLSMAFQGTIHVLPNSFHSLHCSIMQVLNNGAVGFQVQYQLVFCLWVLTFDPNIATIMSK